ncbi:MAG: DNA primase [Lachnospiraceae bacterium]|nr:DNA primase [Lachnospiraceae bacterium]
MFYSDEFVEQVRSENDIVDIISSYVSLKKKGSSWMGCCPFHHEKTPSFSVSKEKQMYHCFGCGVGGNVFTFLMEYESYSFPEAIEYLAEKVHLPLPTKELSEKEKREADYKSALKELNKEAANYFYLLLKSQRGNTARAYFEQRGLAEETIKKFGLGYSDVYNNDLYLYLKKKGYKDDLLKDSALVTINEKGGMDKFWNRVMFPILDLQGKVIGFGGRVLGEGEPKYLNSAETKIFDKSRNLYGMYLAKSSRRDGYILCEGYMDVISMHQYGFDNAVASLGTAFTVRQAMLLKRYTEQVYLAYDSDGAGVKAALRAIPILKEVGIKARIINMKPYKDPDEFMKNLGPEEFELRIKKAESSIMFEVRVLSEKYDFTDPENKTAFYHAVAKKLATIPEPLERRSYIQAVSNQYQLPEKELENLVNSYGQVVQREEIQNQIKEVQAEERAKQKADKTEDVYKLLLTWYINQPILFDKLKELITPKDFLEPFFHHLAEELFLQYNEKAEVNPAAILNQYTQIEEQRKAADIFQTTLKLEPDAKDNDKALTDIVKKVKLSSIEHELANTEDWNRCQQLMQQKKEILKLNLVLNP